MGAKFVNMRGIGYLLLGGCFILSTLLWCGLIKMPWFLSIIVFIPTVLIFPGCSFVFFYRKKSRDSSIIWVFFLLVSLSIQSVVSIIGYHFDIEVSTYNNIVMLFAILGFSSFSVNFIILDKSYQNNIISPNVTISKVFWVIFVSMMAITLLVISIGALYHNVIFDTFYHFGSIYKIFSYGNLNQGQIDPFLGSIAFPLAPYIDNPVYMVFVSIAKLSHTEPNQVFYMLTIFISILTICIIYLTLNDLLNDKFLQLLSLLFFVFYWWGMEVWLDPYFSVPYSNFCAYPGEIARLMLTIYVVCTLRWIKYNETIYILPSCLSLWLSITYHKEYIFQSSFIILVIIFCYTMFVMLERKISSIHKNVYIVLFSQVIFISVFYLLFVDLGDKVSPEAFKLGYRYPEYWRKYGSLGYALDPVWIFFGKPHYYTKFITLIGIIYCYFKSNFVDRLSYFILAGVICIPLLFSFNPILAPIMVKHITMPIFVRMGFNSMLWIYSIFSSVFVALIFKMIGDVIIGIIHNRLGIMINQHILLGGCLMVTILFITFNSGFLSVHHRYLINVNEFLNITKIKENPIINYIRTNISGNDLIASDKHTSYLIGSHTKNRVFSIMWHRMESQFADALSRCDLNNKINSVKTPITILKSIFRSQNIDVFVLRNLNPLRVKIENEKNAFKRVFSDPEYTIYQIEKVN